MSEDRKLKSYRVKDTDGQEVVIEACGFSCGGNGLKFKDADGFTVAWFIRWANWQELSD